MHRRGFLIQSAAAAALLPTIGHAAETAAAAPDPARPDPFLPELQERTFRFFWETTNPDNGLTPDRWPSGGFCSIASVGFALTAYPVGVERGWVSRDAAARRVLTTLRFFNDAPQGTAVGGVIGHKGFFYHFLDMKTGARFERTELSTVDTALLLAGALFCQSYFDRDDPAEAEIRRLAEALYAAADWPWMQQPPHRSPAINMGWDPQTGFLDYSWHGYNEAMLVYILALGSPAHPVGPEAWTAWTRDYDRTWGKHFGPQDHLGFPPMFGHHYSHVWIDFRGIADPYMARRGIDYFENSRRATYAQRGYAIANPDRWKGYGPDVWGLTACDGPADVFHVYAGKRRRFRTYSARGPRQFDDGTIAPTAAVGSLPFAPEIVVPCALEMRRRYGEHIYGRYGFIDAFNPSFDFDDAPPAVGERIPGFGWVGPDYIGIDQGPILTMIENWRTGMVWRVMRTNPHIRRGLTRAGFTGGWLSQP
jgi:hypothetical protein